MAFKSKKNKSSNFSRISISIASPEEILEQSHGEVTKPETINYRTYKPERDGLFCERIFGPIKDYECHCGKYKRIKYRGIICDRCGVEVTTKNVRRERMGHINLVVPVAHIWYFKSLPNKIGYLLGLPTKKLESIIYYEKYVIIQAGAARDQEVIDGDFISEDEYFEIQEKLPKDNHLLEESDPERFIAKMGGEALHSMLSRINLDELSYQLRDKASNETSQQRKSDALKRLNVVEAFRESKGKSRPEWLVVKIVPVIPPELRPLVPLDGGRFATSDLNDLYRRVVIRNNRLKRLMETKAPDVILRNEKRMLQESVDSLFDNSRKANSIKTDNNRPLKSLSDSLKGKQGRFRQNLLGKRVDYSARSVIVVGPELKMGECGIPKGMASELYKPFIIRKLIERGVVKTVKSAKKIVDRKDPIVWDILENVLKSHPVLLNRAPTLHKLGIQAFQPKLIEGKAIQLHPLACTGFNADFDGDQMAVHLPLSSASILEAQFLMLSSHNILNPANGAPVTVPSQDMVLGLYYITKPRTGQKGEGMTFYSPKEVEIALNEGIVTYQTVIKCRVKDIVDGKTVYLITETTVGRVIFNNSVPEDYGYINKLITKKSLRDIIVDVINVVGFKQSVDFLDKIKNLGFTMAFRGGLSFNLSDIIIPADKEKLVAGGKVQIEEIWNNYNMGFITDNERYNQIIDIWTNVNANLTKILMDRISTDNQGFNSVFMMLDSGARGSKEQIRQLSGMRGLMAKPQKSSAAGGRQIIENPILANFKEGLSVLEYFISTHGARKGLADTALKTADAGYLTRRLVDVASDVIVREQDCGTLRSLDATALLSNNEVVESLYEKVLGRTASNDVYHPLTGDIIIEAGEEINEKIASEIEKSPIESVEIRSVLTCESKKGVCAKCYGRDLARLARVQLGEAVGVIAAQSIGEPGTQLTLRTFHVGGTAGNTSTEQNLVAKFDGVVKFTDLKTLTVFDEDLKKESQIVTGRMAEFRLEDSNTGIVLMTSSLAYGSKLYFKEGDTVKKSEMVFEWDPYNALIISEEEGKIQYINLIENVNFVEESDEQTGYSDRIVIETRDKTKNPEMQVINSKGEMLSTFNIPVGAHLMKSEGDKVVLGETLVKIPRNVGKAGDITGGLPRVTELFEARNPSNPAVVSEINGEVTFGKVKRARREVFVTAKTGEVKKYLIQLSKQILVQEHDYIKAGTMLSEGAVTPADILAIQGATKVQQYIVNEVQEVYRLQGVKINDKHFEVIVRQMLKKVAIVDPGDTRFLEGQLVDKLDLMNENDEIMTKKIVIEVGLSNELKIGQIVSTRKLREVNSVLKRNDKPLIQVRDVNPATSKQVLQGITKASLQTKSFMSAASFQETTKILNDAAIRGKVDHLEGLKENVICGNAISAGTGLRQYDDIIVGSQSEFDKLKGLEKSK